MLIPAGDYVFKLQRAHRHLNDLEFIHAEWLNHNTLRHERDMQNADRLRIFVTVEEVPLDPFVLTVGDALHNLRGSLDHLAFAISKKHAKVFTEKMAKDSEFPIFGDERSVGAAVIEQKALFTKKIEGMPPGAQAEVKRLQPYQLGSDYVSHPLWLLHELSNLDKHRLLLIAQFNSKGTIFRSKIPKMYRDILIPTSGILVKGETEIASFAIDPDHEVDMKLDPFLEIVFNCGSKIVDRKGVLSTLWEIKNFIIKRVIPPLVKFL